MKKSLVLAMAMALGVTASAYAANPFSDVPAGHWAYDSINKLAAAGVIEGYGDATFGGDKLMTRYEMAQIVAKAMAKGADVDKLAAEFADELDNLGVRVASLEKKADNVKITGQIRAHYQDNNNSKASKSQLRTRLFVNGAINDDWSYTGRLQNIQDLAHSNAGEDGTDLNWAFVNGKIGGVAVTAGRQDFKLHTGSVVDNTVDGVKVAYGKDVKVTGYAGKAASFTDNAGDRFYAVDVAGKIGVVDAYATYYKIDAEYEKNAEIIDATTGLGTGTYKVADNYPALDQDIYVVGLGTNLAKDLKLNAEWLHANVSDYDGDKDGYIVGLSYKGAKAAKAGSWGLYANYFNQPQATFVKHTITGYTALPVWAVADGADEVKDYADGFKGYEVGANYAFAKNIVGAVRYYDLEAREGNAKDVRTLWSEVVFTF
ncbi:S-layer homology domain-containing protein [uncultured Phascolarctobacterium sp.]|uniref:S-layer homology domain-containing protein n=1 Tax=uncultured Phascolarctobacterium sp. TaxID=512296 RepID=UPI0025EA3CC3|nr:S-layer homology domain-containing protein [uncultured Phascolarctobacterium sp.]